MGNCYLTAISGFLNPSQIFLHRDLPFREESGASRGAAKARTQCWQRTEPRLALPAGRSYPGDFLGVRIEAGEGMGAWGLETWTERCWELGVAPPRVAPPRVSSAPTLRQPSMGTLSPDTEPSTGTWGH